MDESHFKEIRRAYGFDEVAIVPGDMTINPDQVTLGLSIADIELDIPVLASAMDAVVSPAFASQISRLGGLGVMNLEGIQTRYEDPDAIFGHIIEAPQGHTTEILQRLYSAPIKENLIGDRIRQIKSTGAICAVSVTPPNTKYLAPYAVEAGADVLVIQGTVTTARHISKSKKGLVFSELRKELSIPVIVGNCVSYGPTLELMEQGIDGILVGVGPGAACTTREVTGVGVPQVTATIECAAARETYLRQTGRYVTILTDGGIRTGGDLCKAIASGADGVMLGTPFAQANEAPGKGYNWGMANPHHDLPRGTRVKVGTSASLEQILQGPTSVTDGTQNLMGALSTAMGMCGAMTIREMQRAELIIAPAMKTEGKIYQALQNV